MNRSPEIYRTIQTSEGTQQIIRALMYMAEEMHNEWTPQELGDAAIENGFLEISFDRDYLRCIDKAQDLTQQAPK